MLAGAAGFGVLELVLAPQEELFAVCALLFATGICYMLWGTSALASLQLAAPRASAGQAASLYYSRSRARAARRLAGRWLTAQGGTKLAFAVAGTSAILVAIAGTVALFGFKPRTTRSRKSRMQITHSSHALPVRSRHST